MRESKNARERECKGKMRNTRQSEGKSETLHKEKHKKPSVSKQEMEHSKHKHTQEKAAALEYHELVNSSLK